MMTETFIAVCWLGGGLGYGGLGVWAWWKLRNPPPRSARNSPNSPNPTSRVTNPKRTNETLRP